MTYNANIPQGTDNISVSQAQILANFGQINSQFGIDHTPFNTGTGNGDGFHKKVTWLDQSGGVPAAPGATKIVAYGKTVNSITMPYYKRDVVATEFSLAPIKAYALLTATGPNVNPTINKQFNIASVTCSSATYTVTLSNAMNTTGVQPYGVICNLGVGLSPTITYISPTVFTLNGVVPVSVAVGTVWSLIVLEA